MRLSPSCEPYGRPALPALMTVLSNSPRLGWSQSRSLQKARQFSSVGVQHVLAGAGALAMTLNALATLLWARFHYGGPPLTPLLATGLRALPVAAVAGAAGAWASRALEGAGTGSLTATSSVVRPPLDCIRSSGSSTSR